MQGYEIRILPSYLTAAVPQDAPTRDRKPTTPASNERTLGTEAKLIAQEAVKWTGGIVAW